MKAIVRVLDEVFMAIIGLKSEHIDYFYEKYGIHAPNYFFNPKFKLGRWDGKIRFFQRTAKNSQSGKTYLYLAEEILPQIAKLGYKIQLEDNRKNQIPYPDKIDENIFSDILHLDTQQPIILKPHQVEAVNSLIEHGNGVVVASTGSGKTLVTSALVKAYDKYNIRSLTIVPNQDLIKQTKSEYINCKLDTGEYSGSHKTLEHKHIVSTWQALKNNPSLVAHFQMVIVDECLDENTLITMADQTQKKIKDVYPGDLVITFNEKTKTFEPNPVVKKHENLSISSQEKMYRLDFDNGTYIEITGNHKILTNRGYVRADELTFDDEIVGY